MAIREGAWDCPSCGRLRNRGPAKFCGGCGAPRGSDVKFYLPEDAQVVAGEAEIARAKVGPDWTCAYCEGDNPADAGFCSGCGASKDGKPREVVEYQGEAPSAKPAAGPSPVPPQALASAPPPGKRSSRLKKGCGIGCLSIVGLILLFWFLGRPRETDLAVAGFHWERAIQLEQMRTVEEGAWEGELPAGARPLASSQKLHHVDKIQIGTQRKSRTVSEQVQVGTEQVKTGTRDMGNGYFEDVYESRPVYESRSHEEAYDEPVYRDQPVVRMWVRYNVDKWFPLREEQLARDDHAPAWPPVQLGGGEREGPRRELYQVIFRGADGKTHVYKAPSEADWRRFEPGRSYRAKVWPKGDVESVLGPH